MYKSQRFFMMLREGRLDKTVMDAYQIAVKKRGTSRLEVTKIINRFLHRDEKGKHVMNTTDPIFRDIGFHNHKGYHDSGHQGVGFDEAKAKCGNCAESLREGVDGGRIKTSGDPEQFKNMMFFPCKPV